jgi:transposase InsO family protein
MPWKVSGVVEKRREFVCEYESGEWTMTDLCQAYGISRVTGYAVWRRWQEQGEAGLEERSREPRWHPNQTAAEIEEEVLGLRAKHPKWGPRKLKAWLERERAGVVWPAASTMGELLRREGLVQPRKKRRRVEAYGRSLAAGEEPNRVWCADFKGWFRTGDGERIDPFTLTDGCSRYLLRCQAVEKADTLRVQAVMAAAFREYGMPEAIRTDNGAPFASRALAGLSALPVWLMKLGIVPERIAAGHPEQNGRHERMHRTLKQETASPPAANRRAQQRAFDRFRQEFNQERPHEALGQRTPSSIYQPSPRSYPARLPQPEYGSALATRKVGLRGEISWKHQEVFLTEALIGERVGLEPIDERYWRVYFAAFPIALFDSRELRMQKLAQRETVEMMEIPNPGIPTFPPPRLRRTLKQPD